MTTVNGKAVFRDAIAALDPLTFRQRVIESTNAGRRIAALFGAPPPDGPVRITAVLADDEAGSLEILACDPAGGYKALTPDCPQAHLFEREIHEQTGIVPEGHPWLKPVRSHAIDHPFFSVQGEEVHEVAVGPVHAGIIDPGHFRLQCHGETVLHLEIQLGYQHRGVERSLAGGPDNRSALLAECIAGDTTIGHALAHAGVVEALAGSEVPPRASAVRAIALELERIANHVGDLGALGNDIGFLPTSAYFGRLRGEFLGMLMSIAGSRYGRGLVRPGGVHQDITGPMAADLVGRLARARGDLRGIAALFFDSPSVRARLEGTGTVTRAACDDLGLVGPAARACGAARDVRHDHPLAGSPPIPIPIAVETAGDVYARAHVRWQEIERSIDFLAAQLPSIPGGDLIAPPGRLKNDSLAVCLVEGWRGEIAHVATTGGDGRFARYRIKDPSFLNWSGLAMAMRNAAVSDFPLCNKSFNLSYAGHDL